MKISVIIPVYNVEDWLDECLNSIMKQSFHDFEVILIDDGSTDGSGDKCIEWEKKDSRIKVLRQKNAGPSAARNSGIKAASGEYLSFIDADDWVDEDFFQYMYAEVEKTHADIIECDVWRYNNLTGKKTYHACYGCMGKEYTKEERMVYGHTAIWKCLFRRRLFLEYDICFPFCHSEARAVYALLVALSNQVVSVRKPLYYYRKFRNNSLSAKPRHMSEKETAIGIQAFIELIAGFKRCGIYEQYEQLLEKIIKYKLSDLLAGMFTRRSTEEFFCMVADYRRFVQEVFPNNQDKTYVVIGGYNLARITWHMNMLHIPSMRFNFSSIVSVMNPITLRDDLKCSNKYRQVMVSRDVKSEFWDIMKRENPKYIVLDFLEERFNLIKYNEGYLTMSDAYMECERGIEDSCIVRRDSMEGQALWEKSCQEFLCRLQREYPNTVTILVKNYLSEQYGDVFLQQYYDDLEKIQGINKRLDSYYKFFCENAANVRVIEASREEYYFTDKQYEYGVIPSHLNELVNIEIAKEIEDAMR